MKKIILCCAVLLGLASCSDQLAERELANAIQPVNQVNDEYHYYLEKARWGDACAYIKLADCYRNGVGVKADFIGMTVMLTMAEQYDNTLQLKDYFKALPEDDSYRLLYETMDEIGKKNQEEVKNVAEALVANGKPEGYVINGAMQIEEGDTIGGLETIRYSAEQGSTFGEFIMLLAPKVLTDPSKTLDVEGIVKLAEKSPCAYKILGDMYAGEVCDSVFDEKRAAFYYQEADKYGFLGKKGARWLLDYYERENNQIDELEKQRLLALCKESEEEYVVTEEM